MDFEKVADAIEKSSPEIRNLLYSEEICKLLEDIAEQNNLNEETTLKMIDEIGYIILGLKERSTIKNSLGSIGVSQDAVLSIITEISRKVFTELDKIELNYVQKREKVEGPMPTVSSEPEQKTVIPEIPPANLPMVEAGEAAHDVPHAPARQDLAGSEPEKKLEKPNVTIPDYRYEGGKDPYREPLV